MRFRLSIAVVASIGSIAASVSRATAQTEAGLPALDETGFLLSVGSIVDPGAASSASGAVLGVEGEVSLQDLSLTVADRLFIPATLNGQRLGLGDQVQFFRLERSIFDPVSEESLGRLLLPTGVGLVDSLAGEVARARVSEAYLPIQMTDRVRAIGVSDTTPATRGTGSGPIEGRVVAFQTEKAIHPPYDIVFLNQPRPFTLVAGETLVLYRPAGDLPDTILARAVVIRPEERIAAAILTETYRSDLVAGDHYRRGTP